MTTDYSDLTARVLDGEALRIGELFWPRPEPPLIMERAKLVRAAIPSGTIAAGVSAGWVWTGMGIPTPLSLIASASPAPSPLLRHEWRIRGRQLQPSHITVLGPLTLLTRHATIDELWQCEASDEVAAAQLFWLKAAPPAGAEGKAKRRMQLVLYWRASYPWATR